MGTYPTPEKTWEYAHVSVPGTGTKQGDIGEILFQWKEAVVALNNLPWVVAGSSNGTTGAMDAVDRITSGSIPQFTGGVSWWMVLEAPSGWGGGQILVTSNNGGTFSCLVETRWSVGGLYTGGGATTLPTATDEDSAVNLDFIDWSGFPNGGDTAIQILHSTDGQHTRAFFAFQNLIKTWIVTETAGAPGSDWADPRFYGRGPRFNLESLTEDVTFNVGREWWRLKIPGTSSFSYMMGDREIVGPSNGGTLITDLLATPNEISSEHPFFTVGLYGHTTAGVRGQGGYLKDWWYSTPAVNPGDGFPGNGDKDFLVLGPGCIVPWDGTTADLG